MINKYKGYLGNFRYDDREFKLIHDSLRYIGNETDGSKIKIPEGITDCSYMFSTCISLVEPPTIPAEVTNCSYMFYNCSSLVEAPAIPAGVTDCYSMFRGCSSLQNYSLIVAQRTQRAYYNCSLVIQEIDNFIQNFKERNQLNDKTV